MAMMVSNPSGVDVTDDGTNLDFSYGGVKYFSFRKSDGQMLVSAGIDTDQTL